MSLQLTTARPNCRQRPEYGIYFRIPNGKRKTGNHEIRLRLRSDPRESGAPFRCCLPSGTPIHRVRSARDIILRALDDGMLNTPAAWDALASQIRRQVKTLNTREGIRPHKPWSLTKSRL